MYAGKIYFYDKNLNKYGYPCKSLPFAQPFDHSKGIF